MGEGVGFVKELGFKPGVSSSLTHLHNRDEFIVKRYTNLLRMARVKGLHSLHATHTFIHERNEPSCLYSQLQSITALS